MINDALYGCRWKTSFYGYFVCQGKSGANTCYKDHHTYQVEDSLSLSSIISALGLYLFHNVISILQWMMTKYCLEHSVFYINYSCYQQFYKGRNVTELSLNHEIRKVSGSESKQPGFTGFRYNMKISRLAWACRKSAQLDLIVSAYCQSTWV